MSETDSQISRITMTQSHRGARLLAILAALAFAIIPARAQVLNSQEQAVANLLTTAGGQLRNKSVMRLDPALAAVARARAKDMAVRGYFAHVNPSGKGPNYLVRAAGFPLPAWWGTDPTDNTIESISAGLSSASQTWSSLLDSPPSPDTPARDTDILPRSNRLRHRLLLRRRVAVSPLLGDYHRTAARPVHAHHHITDRGRSGYRKQRSGFGDRGWKRTDRLV